VTTVRTASICFVLVGLVPLVLGRLHPFRDAGLDASVQVGDPSRGRLAFEKRCTGCHSLTDNHEGPRLRGVYGRDSGSVSDYAYSPSLKNAGIVWDARSLDKWLTDPDALIPGNNMDFQVAEPVERRDLIAFLRQSSSK